MADIEYREVIVDGSAVIKPEFRSAIIQRSAYVIADSESPSDLTVQAAGIVPFYLIFDGRLFRLDADDTSSGPPDNQTLIVTADGYRYFSDGLSGPITHLLEANVNDPPGSPTIGDSYHTGPSPTGDWAGHPNVIATFTRRGWAFSDIQIGQAIYVEADQSFRHMDENGVFQLGLGVATISDDSIRDTMVIGGLDRRVVENQTTNNPPSKVPGVWYIVGPAPTGEWAGNTGKLATSFDGVSWTLLTPKDGYEAFDKAIGANFIYRTGKGWTFAGGAWSTIADVSTDGSGSTTSRGSLTGTGYVYSNTSPPTTGDHQIVDDNGITHAAARSANPGEKNLRIDYSVRFEASASRTGSGSNGRIAATIALFRDNETNAIAWCQGGESFFPDDAAQLQGGSTTATGFFLFSAPDASNHTYKIAVVGKGLPGATSGLRMTINSLSHRTLQLMEKF